MFEHATGHGTSALGLRGLYSEPTFSPPRDCESGRSDVRTLNAGCDVITYTA